MSLGAATEPTPFLRLRDRTLSYHGTDQGLTNLTEIRIGWFGPTQATSGPGTDMWCAANLALEDFSSQLSALRSNLKSETASPRFITAWATDPWGTGVSQLARMVYRDEPLALLGSVDSATTHLAEQVVAKANLPLVSPIATDGSVTLAGVPWMFACAPSDAAIARLLVDDVLATLTSAGTKTSEVRSPKSEIEPGLVTRAAAEGKQGSRLALLAGTDHESRMTAREVVRELSRRGRMPDFRFDVPAGTTTFETQLDALAEAKPRTLLVIASAEDAARLVSAARPRLPECAVFGSHTLGRTRFRELAGAAAEGVRFPLLFDPLGSQPATARFVERFNRARGCVPDYTAALTYDATCLLLQAIRQAGPNRARLREALHALSPWNGIAGPIAFDGTGQNTRAPLAMGTIRNHTVIALPPSPSDLAQHHPSLP